MNKSEKAPLGFLHETDALRKLILENPSLPLVVFAGQDANVGDYSTMSCGRVNAYRGEILDCQQEIDDCRCYTDRDDFREDVENMLAEGEVFEGSEEEFQRHVDDVAAEYDPYWKDCIILTVDN